MNQKSPLVKREDFGGSAALAAAEAGPMRETPSRASARLSHPSDVNRDSFVTVAPLSAIRANREQQIP
jgi:hypothetical protein